MFSEEEPPEGPDTGGNMADPHVPGRTEADPPHGGDVSGLFRDAIFPDFSGIPDFHKTKLSM